MKKLLPSVLFLCLLLPFSFPLFAREEASPPLLAVSPIQGESVVAGFPYEFSVAPGKWSQARAGKFFTREGYRPDFVFPALKEKPVPIRYPRWAVREGWEGTLVIAVEILKTGEVGRWKVMESTGYSLLDEAALTAIRKWRFHPAREQGVPIVSCIQVPVHFEITE